MSIDEPRTDHRIMRARERYGVELSHEDLKGMAALCTPHNVCRRDERGTVHAIQFRGTQFIVCAVPKRQGVGMVIATMLPPDEFRSGCSKKDRIKRLTTKGKKVRNEYKHRKHARRIGGGTGVRIDA